MKPATMITDNGAFSVQKSIFEFSLRARKITILGALATQFHEISGLIHFKKITRAGFINLNAPVSDSYREQVSALRCSHIVPEQQTE